MTKKYFYLFYTIVLSLFIQTSITAQCSVSAPADTSITCGSSTSFTASTTSVSYSVTSSACTPVAITGTTAFPTACDDCVTGQIPIGFSFNFYGNTYTDTVISSNGLVGFGPFTYTGYTPFTIPAAGNPNNYIAGLMADIDIRYGGTITYATVGTAPNREFVISYQNVVPYNSGSGAGTGTASFQIILQENGGFRVVISQFSANWSASTSGAFATSGAENSNGTYAFPVPGRNNTDWPGITPGAQDCHIFNPIPCVFQRWQVGATIVSMVPNLTVSPLSATTYTAYWNCGGNICSDDTVVSISSVAQTITQSGVTNNTNCNTTNGAIQLTMTAIPNGTYTLNYLNNGSPQTQSVNISGSPTNISIPNLNSGTYSNFSITTGGCGAPFLAGPITITGSSIAQSTVTDNSNCSAPNGSILFNTTNLTSGTYTLNYNFNGTPTSQSVTLGGGSTIAQSTAFNVGALTATDPTWFRNTGGTFCGASAGAGEYYDVYAFTVSAAGSYTFNMCAPNIDAHASLYQNAFNGANPCGTPANFIIANDDSAPLCGADPQIVATLTTGVTYYLISTTFSSGDTDTYDWNFTGPAGATLIIGNPTFTLGNLAGGDYTNLQLGGSCGNMIPGPIKIINTNVKTWDGSNSTNWNGNNNWTPNTRPTSNDCVIIPDASTTPRDPIIQGAAYEALAGTLTIENGGLLTVNANTFLSVTNSVTVVSGGTLDFLNDSSLIQTNSVANSGNINYNRSATGIRGSDYVYWSSPVANQNLSALYSTPAPGPIYQWNTTAPNANAGLGTWGGASGNMTAAKGYIIRGSSNYGLAATTINSLFTGTPNNGNITINAPRGNMVVANVGPALTYSNPALNAWNDNWSLLGNPYPSAINALQFLSTNSANLSGNVRLWRHLSTPAAIANPFYQNFGYNYNSSDYLTINFTGPTTPGASDVIKAGQAFMVQRLEGAQDLTGVPVNFNNAMRLSPTSTVLNNQSFFRSSNNNNLVPAERNRIWLDIVDNSNLSSETTLIGYVDEATVGFDSKFDATIGTTSAIGIYSFADTEKCIIQGRPNPFSIVDEVPLGINVHSNGNYHIAINAIDGLFASTSQIIYLEDKLLNIVHNLTQTPYSFNSQSGTFENRFVLKYTNQTLSTNDVDFYNTMIFTNNTINIKSLSNSIKEVIVYDVLGKVILEKNKINKTEISLHEISPTSNILIVKAILENNAVVVKKVLY